MKGSEEEKACRGRAQPESLPAAESRKAFLKRARIRGIHTVSVNSQKKRRIRPMILGSLPSPLTYIEVRYEQRGGIEARELVSHSAVDS